MLAKNIQVCSIVLCLLLANIVLSDGGIVEAFHENKIVPDVIRVAPRKIVQVTYDDNHTVLNGNELTPTEVRNKPTVSGNGAITNSYYTLAMVDPDAPSRTDPTSRNWLHWLIVNVPGSDILAGDVLAEYIGAAPPKDTGLHRYVFLIYLQPDKKNFESEPKLTNRSTANRDKFSINDFATRYNLSNPVGGNFFQAQYDDYVPILYQSLDTN